MLIITRRLGESFVIDDDVTVRVVKLSEGSVRIGIEAPDEVTILRSELLAPGRSPEPRKPGRSARRARGNVA